MEKTSAGIILPGSDKETIITPSRDILLPQGTKSAEDGHLARIDLVQGGALGTETLNCLTGPSNAEMSEAGFANPKQLNELKSIFIDLLSGDPAASHDDRFSYLNFKQIKLALEWLMTNNFDERLQSLLLERPYLLTFKNKPPTPEEFLTHKYIGSMADSLWLPLRKAFVEYFDPMKPYRTAALNPSIGAGKSTFTQMALLFVAASFALMRDPWKFFNKSKTTIFAITLCAVTLTKAKEIYEEPIRQLIESADFWRYCRTHKEMLDEENHLLESEEVEYIPWGHGGNTGVFKTGNNMTWKVISNANSLLGVNILMGAMTEITFFREAGKGWTDEKIFNFFSKLRERISNRFQNNYYARMILDSSPSTLEDPIQNWMTYDAPKDESCFVWRGARWDLYPEEFPEYEEVANPGTYDYKATNQKHTYDVAFQLYKGGNGKPPVACENELEASHYQPADLIWCPKKQVTLNGISNFLTKAKENPIEFMKDWAGLPAGTPDRLFYRNDWIENVFDNGLKNIYGSIIALADDEPEHLIWDKIWPMFFYKMMNKFYFYYEHDAPRVVSIDQSKSRDCTCIAMSHLELDPERIDEHTKRPLTVYITDFTIVLIPKGGHINLDAIKHFIYDLKVLGGLNIRHVSFDGWQSEPARQALKRSGINVDYVSVDSDNEPYYMFYDAVTHGRYFAGKNIFMKNNMKSLHEVRRKRTGSVKIDHFEGDLNYEWENGTWESCTAGINAKDCLDAVAANLHLFSMYPEEFIATKKFYKEDKLERDYDTIKDKNTSFLESGKINGMKFKI